jgi:hypothetical protein
MDPKIIDGLDKLFEAKQAEEQRIAAIRGNRESTELIYLAKFLETRTNLYRPAFEEFAQVIELRGIKVHIAEHEDQPPAEGAGAYQSASISITFFIGDRTGRQLHGFPNFSITCLKHSQKLRLHRSTISPKRGGTAGALGEVEIESVTTELIHKYLFDIMHACLETPQRA